MENEHEAVRRSDGDDYFVMNSQYKIVVVGRGMRLAERRIAHYFF